MNELDPLAVPTSGVVLIEASAGTGKTHTVTTLFVRLLVEQKLVVSQILVVTFTHAAAAELRERVRRRLRQAVEYLEPGSAATDPELLGLFMGRADRERDRECLRAALASFDEASIFTIHGYCQRALERHAFESGVRFNLRLITDPKPMILEWVRDFWLCEVGQLSAAQVRYLETRGVSLDALYRLARMVVAWPGLPIEPSGGSARPGALVDALGAYASLCDHARSVYFGKGNGEVVSGLGVRDRVREILSGARMLKQNIYSDDKRFKLLHALDRRLSVDEVVPRSAFASITQSRLNAGTRAAERPPEHPFFQLCEQLDAAGVSLDRELEAWVLEFLLHFIRRVRQGVARQHAQGGTQSFDELLHGLLRALRTDRGGRLAKRLALEHPVALIDEFQDTDVEQYEIFRTIYKAPSTLFLIGDPKQAIYSFRGADIFSYLTAVRAVGTARHTLLRNYRSDPCSVAATNALFSRIKLPFLFDEIAFHRGDPKPGAEDSLRLGGKALSGLEILFVPREPQAAGPRQPKPASDRDLPALAARHIRDFLDSGATLAGEPVLPRDIAVLTRTNAQAQSMQIALRASGIPSVLFGDSNVFNSDEAPELGLILSAMADPVNARAVRGALSTSVFGTTGEELARLADDEAGWEKLLSGFHAWHDLWKTRGFVQAFRRLLADHDVLPRLLGQPGGERKLTNLLHLVELLHEQASARHLGITGLLEWFRDMHFGLAREPMAPDAQQIRLESDAHAVKLTTVHRSKGLQYPVVYCPYLWGGPWMSSDDEQFLRYHEPPAPSSPFGQVSAMGAEARKLDIRHKDEKKDHIDAAWREAYAENLRLLYVALTRAKHRTLVAWGGFRNAAASPLAYVLHQPLGAAGAPDTATEERVRKLDDRAMLQELDALTKESNGAIGVSLLTEASSRSYAEESPPGGQLSRRVWSRAIDRSFRGASFSALAASGDKLSLPAEEGRDLDEGLGDETLSLPQLARLGDTTVLGDLPRGVRAGQMLHSIFEHHDFQSKRDETLSGHIASTLERYGFERERLAHAVELTVLRTLDTELDAAVPGLRLALLSKQQRLDELEFTLPVSPDSAFGAGTSPAHPRPLTARALARAFREHATLGEVRRYAEAIEHLGFAPLTGYLRGFIDLVFVYAGRFYIVDYKSNHLGTDVADYSARRLAPAMGHHHYYLQYHLYTVAVHRYLAQRIAGYDYEHHFGGVYYLFLRGLRPELGPKCGVFRDRPALALVEALERALGPLLPHASTSMSTQRSKQEPEPEVTA